MDFQCAMLVVSSLELRFKLQYSSTMEQDFHILVHSYGPQNRSWAYRQVYNFPVAPVNCLIGLVKENFKVINRFSRNTFIREYDL